MNCSTSLAEGLSCALPWGGWNQLKPAGTGQNRQCLVGAAPPSPHSSPAASAWACKANIPFNRKDGNVALIFLFLCLGSSLLLLHFPLLCFYHLLCG